jgi:predicted metal-dependent phosphotriesterase family hydrolase
VSSTTRASAGATSTLQLLEWAAEDGLLGHITLGLDAARQGYWTQFGGTPGWAWLLADFAAMMHERGLGDAEQHILFVEAPGAAFSFGTSHA